MAGTGSMIGTGLGAGAGFLIGGPMGAGVGASLGGMAGGMFDKGDEAAAAPEKPKLPKRMLRELNKLRTQAPKHFLTPEQRAQQFSEMMTLSDRSARANDEVSAALAGGDTSSQAYQMLQQKNASGTAAGVAKSMADVEMADYAMGEKKRQRDTDDVFRLMQMAVANDGMATAPAPAPKPGFDIGGLLGSALGAIPGGGGGGDGFGVGNGANGVNPGGVGADADMFSWLPGMGASDGFALFGG